MDIGEFKGICKLREEKTTLHQRSTFHPVEISHKKEMEAVYRSGISVASELDVSIRELLEACMESSAWQADEKVAGAVRKLMHIYNLQI